MIQSFDVIIVGGGMVGLTFAAALKESDLRIAVIEETQPKTELGWLPDVRVSALNRASQSVLANLGVWSGIEQRRSSPYTGMHVWEQDSFARIDFSAAHIGQPDLGHIVENRVVQLALLDTLYKQENVSLFMPDSCQCLIIGESEVWLTLDSGVSLTGKLIVGADGANSWLREQADIPLTHWDYGQSAIVANVRTHEPHCSVARQVFTPYGPLAFLPHAEPDMSAIVWSAETRRAEKLLSVSEPEFNKILSAEFDMSLGLCEVIGQRAGYPLRMRYARDFVQDRLALIGDAAHTIHPLAGQGVNLGLMDAASLAQEIQRLWKAGEDIGTRINLRPYERWRKAEAARMIAAMQGFKALFDGDNPVKKLLRGFGMQLADQLPGAKSELMQRALGLKGELPELARDYSFSD
ncbi:FAD-dependent 2-octaprenylphenol hydroxylase [Vibrio sp. HA2012]|uniref:FAD-dependent 2-octaprenylphenol hydroxylase n=1 Tax=Vibrio sp. HA2012 TaxID=1971595 RepID=UPI000C2C7D4B|nr:FAD-dependent 2-octaprenylphenol hydroxylase [Vibrio sp. HA2012]PJC86273.1 FAD-dependent 2-octaprenylphenol hydroxylase [Vibrio sp. HA2012]